MILYHITKNALKTHKKLHFLLKYMETFHDGYLNEFQLTVPINALLCVKHCIKAIIKLVHSQI